MTEKGIERKKDKKERERDRRTHRETQREVEQGSRSEGIQNHLPREETMEAHRAKVKGQAEIPGSMRVSAPEGSV